MGLFQRPASRLLAAARVARGFAAACAAVASMFAAACGAGGTAAPDRTEWRYTTETEGNVTTVRTTAGSKWGADVRLVEELEIGVDEGPAEYMFARIADIWATGDRVVVADSGLPAVRAYDAEGNWLFDVGSQGQGPGEYERPAGVGVLPDGRILVHGGSRILVFDADGNHLVQWTIEQRGGFSFFGPGMMAITSDGTVYHRKPVFPEEGSGSILRGLRWSMQAIGPEGSTGEPLMVPEFDYERPVVEVTGDGGRGSFPVPFAPQPQWAMTPEGGFVAGLPLEYRFEIRHPDGRTTVVEKYHDPVPVSRDELELRKRQPVPIVINGRRPAVDWGSLEIPTHKPAYSALWVGRDGRIFVSRSGPATVDPACLEPDADPSEGGCVQEPTWIDVFDPDGMFLGTFQLPDGVSLGYGSFLDGDLIWAPVEDELGTVTVKRFRIQAGAAREAVSYPRVSLLWRRDEDHRLHHQALHRAPHPPSPRHASTTPRVAYSARKATTGSVAAARRAGSQQAAVATATRIPAIVK